MDISAFPLFEAISAAATVATAGIAYKALRNWQSQERAKRQAEFLDQFLDATHAFVIEINKPIGSLRSAKMGMASHVETWADEDEEEKILNGAIAYIQKRAERTAGRMREALSALDPILIQMSSLLAKGQVFQFSHYVEAERSIHGLMHQANRLNSFLAVIDSPSWNWGHPEIRELLRKIMAIDPDEIKLSVGQHNSAMIAFVRDRYEDIYGKPRSRPKRSGWWPLRWRRGTARTKELG
uniref:Uncharacterized protein n=1 Tax=viral metagenome TaxID=1070528 RepID=A0A6H1ZS92_9ZZZZ